MQSSLKILKLAGWECEAKFNKVHIKYEALKKNGVPISNMYLIPVIFTVPLLACILSMLNYVSSYYYFFILRYGMGYGLGTY